MTDTKGMLQGIAKGLDDVLKGPARPKKIGFALLVFPFGSEEGRQANYVSNASREDMIVAMKEWLARNEGRAAEAPEMKQ